ncbi:uncharacterized protein ACB058_021716 [Synchiropus picturatus]
MWEQMDDTKFERRDRNYSSNVRIELPPPFAGDEEQGFPCWVRQYEVAVSALVGNNDQECEDELSRILPTRLTKAAFLLWDSLPRAVQRDYAAVKARLMEAFGHGYFLDRFRTNLSARMRAPGESLDVYAADISRLVHEAFPNYGQVAQREEKYRRFLAGLDPALRAKCHEQGAADLEEALMIASRCEMAREALKMDYGTPYQRSSPVLQSAGTVNSIGTQSSLDRLLDEMREMRVEMKKIMEENDRLRRQANRKECEWSNRGRRCRCTCGELDCQSTLSDRRWRERNREPSQERVHNSGDRGRSPSRRSPEATGGNTPRRGGVRFLSPRRGEAANQSGNAQ